MVSLPSKTAWVKRQLCPCGEWKCFVTFEDEVDETKVGSLCAKNDSGMVEAIVSPYVGMVFKSDDGAFEYYGNFARKNGFSVRKERSRLSPSLGVYKRDFVCYRAGFAPIRKKQIVEHQRDRKSVRCGCDAKMYLSKEIVEGVPQWFVSQFSDVHNHELLEDDQVRLLPAYRKIHESDQERILLLSKAGFPIHRIVKVLELEKGMHGGQISFLERDVRNFIQNHKKVIQQNDTLLMEKRENDIADLLETCKASKDMDPSFVYDISVDENDKLERIAWSFGDCVRAYDTYGDVVYFDSTYHSTTYGMLFGAWLGIDNNGKIIFFGCVLLQDETPRSFSWAIQAFLRFMKGRSPQTIITDIDTGLRDAIRSEFPRTKHVISLYKILPRISSWFSLALGTRFNEFKTEFEVLYHLEGVEEFEARWKQMVSHFGLGLDKHIILLFSFRACWAFPYTKGCFLARMVSLPFWKSVDDFFRSVLKSHICLRGFIDQFRFSCNYKIRAHVGPQYMHLKTSLPFEEHAREILTPFAFNVLQLEMASAMQYAASEMTTGYYLVQHFRKADGDRLVKWIPTKECIHCSCYEFESSGTLCRHALRVLLVKNYFQLPEKYLLSRWRQESSLLGHNEQNNLNSRDEWFKEFNSLTGTLFSEAVLTRERSGFVCGELTKNLTTLVSQVKRMPSIPEVDVDAGLSSPYKVI